MSSPLFHRSELLIGREAMERLARSRVILFGVGGVGSWCAEALIRSGIGHLTLVDSDCVCITNVNRQLQATPGNVGRYKVDELATRLRSINPDAEIVPRREAWGLETCGDFALETFDYVLDAIDSLSPKLGLIDNTLALGRTLFSSLGASGKLDPTRIRTATIWDSHGCPLARRLRKRLRRRGITTPFKVVFSLEALLENRGEAAACGTDACDCPRFAIGPDGEEGEAHEWCSHKAFINGSMAPVTAAFGFALASLVINDVVAAETRKNQENTEGGAHVEER
ncbi:MAG: tRNA threonylcarbamoyladenosine dehydratase [Pseudomonadota bacterium]